MRTKAIAKNECLYHALEDFYFTMLKKVDGNAFLIFMYQIFFVGFCKKNKSVENHLYKYYFYIASPACRVQLNVKKARSKIKLVKYQQIQNNESSCSY